MKRIIEFVCRRATGIRIWLAAAVIVTGNGVFAQQLGAIKGMIIEKKSNQAVPFATLALIRVADSAMINGAVSDESGAFTLSPVIFGDYRFRVTAVGFKPALKNITVANPGMTDAGIIYLQDTTLLLRELMIVDDRVKAKEESGKTIFFMTPKLLNASGTGMDVLKFIPGIQVDFMQNISLEGSRNIRVFVDGKERDGSYVSQLDPGRIDRIEVTGKPSSDNDGDVTGVINIILKNEDNSSFNGQIYAEIPTSSSEIYIRPGYSLSYGFKKLNLYTSYKGEMTYLDIYENTVRQLKTLTGAEEIISNQYVKQKDWSHRFTYGLDYVFNKHDQLNLYAFYNPYSREFDGKAESQLSGSINNIWQAKKEDMDKNTGNYYSLYYKHRFSREGHEMSVEISDYSLKTKNSTSYFSEGNVTGIPIQVNTAGPGQNLVNAKIDYTARLCNKLDFSTGMKTKLQEMEDSYKTDFKYEEEIVAAYGTITYKHSQYSLSMGLRAEESAASLKNSFSNHDLSLFPNASINFRLTPGQNVQLCFNRSIIRPNLYQMDPHITVDDPYTVSKGNPFLKPETCNNLFLEYSVQFESNYFAARLFYNKLTSVINNLTFINDTGAIETQVQNMGLIHQYGLQCSGTFKLGIVTLNPFLQLFDQYTRGNELTKQYGIENRHNPAYNSGLSAIFSFRHEYSFSFVFQSASPKINIQGNYYCGALYFLSLEKTFQQRIKIGIVCALPFTKSFIYQGSDVNGFNFSSRYKGKVEISGPICWLKLSYQLSKGRKKEVINHATEEIDNLPKKGF